MNTLAILGEMILTSSGVTSAICTTKLCCPSSTRSSSMVMFTHPRSPLVVTPAENVATRGSTPKKSSPSTKTKWNSANVTTSQLLHFGGNIPAFVLLDINTKVTTTSHSRPTAGTPLISAHTISELSLSSTLYWAWLKATSAATLKESPAQNLCYSESVQSLRHCLQDNFGNLSSEITSESEHHNLE